MAIKRLDWDSKFFGFEIGELNFGQPFSNQNQYELLYVKSDSDFESQITGFVPTYSENKVVYSKILKISNNIINNNITTEFKGFPVNELYEIAYESGKYSRFKMDEYFSKNDFERLYGEWIDNSLNKKFADGHLFYIDQGNLCGFVTYKIFESFAVIGLFAVSQLMQGRGIGGKLINAVENFLFEKKIYELRIPTQYENLSACSFYSKMGYKVVESSTIKHYWNLTRI